MRRSSLFLVAVAPFVSIGCSDYGAGMTGARMAFNLSKHDTHLSLSVDGEPAEQNKLKKAVTGYSNWKVKSPVGVAPRLRFSIQDPGKLGRITMVLVSIYQEYEADYSHQAEFTVVARDTNNPDAQMKPDTEYDLGNPGGNFRVTNLTSQEVSGVTLRPGMKYKLLLTVRADHSETAQVEFKTR
ncbi:MAG: hypothetical protein U1A27_04185 [Phycisphaerae bacterium]